jgi:DNA (cytosine-5)-methyltransferase 1
MTRPRLLDACCCAGGATRGYQLAGFHVTGVDIVPQPNYCGDEFVQGDAIEYIREHGREFDLIHASWPCQKFTPLNAYNGKDYPDLVTPGRQVMLETGVPFVIENVPQAPLESPVSLCGSMFGLKLRRHRGFESGNGFRLPQLLCGRHELCTRNGYLPTADRPFMTISGGRHSEAWRLKAAKVMGVPWTKTIVEVCEAIPPAYTRWIGEQWLASQERAA